MIKKYIQFINEADENQPQSNPESTSDNKYQEVKDYLKKKIETTVEKSGGEFDSFVEKFIKNPKDVKIEGVINDSEVYDFYLKFRNDIDEILNNINYFDQVPSENNAFGLYEYIVTGTTKAIEEIVKMLSSK